MLRKLIYQLHLWLGLTTGTVLCFVSLTGCILAFEDEIKGRLENYHTLDQHHGVFQSVAKLREAAAQSLPHITTAHMGCRIDFRGRDKTAIVMFFGPQGLYYCYVNPYQAKVLYVTDMSKDFFRIIRAGHRTLFLGNVGKTLIGYCTILFIFILLSGLFLWWPKKWKKSTLKASFQIRWAAGRKRLSYELHKVLGFYALVPAMILAITGLVIGFPWFAQGYYAAISQGKALVTIEQITSDTSRYRPQSKKNSEQFLDSLSRQHALLRNEHLAYLLPQSRTDPLWIIFNPVAPSLQNMESRFQRRFQFYDQYSLAQLPSSNIETGDIEDATFSQKVFRANYDLHTGRLFGMFTKTFFFFISLVCTSLPITGFLVWKNRRYKTPKKKSNRHEKLSS